MSDHLCHVRFDSILSHSQALAARIIRRQLEAGERQLHIVAPPGSGKTVPGLYIWAHPVTWAALLLRSDSAIRQGTVAARRLPPQ